MHHRWEILIDTSVIDIICGTCSQQYSQRLSEYIKGCRGNCNCSKKKRWDIKSVGEYIKNNGDILISRSYVNNKMALIIFCKECNIQYEQNFDRYKRGFRHKNCSLSYKKPVTMIKKICIQCDKIFFIKKARKQQKTCSETCYQDYKKSETHISNCVKGGLSAVRTNNPRSKNEIYFSELCREKFNHILTNEPMFEGADADVIIPSIKIAIHWNGIWHYKAIRTGMNMERIFKRDLLKDELIIKKGYYPYTIKDLGSHNKKFVEKEFETFINFVEYMDIE